MIKKFQFDFNELKIVPEDLTELLGFSDGTIPEPFPYYINEAISLGPKICNIEGGYKTFEDFEFNTENDTVRIENHTFSPSKIVVTQLKRSDKIVLFACTAGDGISKYSKEIAAEDPMQSYVFDVLGSVTVDKAMDQIQYSIFNEALKNGTNISDRYSPGYCEWSVSEQQMLFDLIPEKFCGITLSDSSLMHPIKSVSGILGIGPELKQIGYQCHWCTDTDCLYGKIKRGKKK